MRRGVERTRLERGGPTRPAVRCRREDVGEHAQLVIRDAIGCCDCAPRAHGGVHLGEHVDAAIRGETKVRSHSEQGLALLRSSGAAADAGPACQVATRSGGASASLKGIIRYSRRRPISANAAAR